MSDLSPSQMYAIAFESSEPKHYTRIPNIIDHLTYEELDEKTGQTIKKRLSVYASHLYRVIKSIANEGNACWMNRDNLAELANMSTGKISECKKELSQKFHQLDGKSLISIEECKKTTMKGKEQSNQTCYHKITIIDIWKWNNAYMATLKFQKKMEALSPGDGADEALSPGDGAQGEALSPGDTNKNPSFNNIPLSKEQQPTADADLSVSSNKEKELFSSDPNIQRAYDWLLKEGFDEKASKEIAIRYSSDDISKAGAYTNRQVDKNKKNNVKTNKLAYLRDCLKYRYWDNKKK